MGDEVPYNFVSNQVLRKSKLKIFFNLYSPFCKKKQSHSWFENKKENQKLFDRFNYKYV